MLIATNIPLGNLLPKFTLVASAPSHSIVETGISAMDIAKGLLDNGIHPPTMYFPLIVEEALMVEPTETESKETLDEAVEVLRKLYEIAETDAEQLHQAPVTTPVTRMDEVGAARHPYLRYEWQD